MSAPKKFDIMTNRDGTRSKFDGRKWRRLCEYGGNKCRELALRQHCCTKHLKYLKDSSSSVSRNYDSKLVNQLNLSI